MGILDFLQTERGRHDSERRIKRRTKTAAIKQNTPDDDSDMEDFFGNYTRQANRLIYRTYDTISDPNRKAEGKAICKTALKQGIGITARAFLGPRKQHPIKTIKLANPTITIKKPQQKRKK